MSRQTCATIECVVDATLTCWGRCVAGRWGTVQGIEDVLHSCWEQYVHVAKHVFAGRGACAPIADVATEGVAEERLEEQAHYREVRGRWKREMLEAISHPLFCSILIVGRRARSPQQHVFRTLEKRITEEELAAKGGHLAQLVTGKCSSIAKEFEALVAGDAEINQAIRLGGSSANACALNEFAVLCILNASASFERRIHRSLRRFPCLLLWFAAHPPTTPCSQRERIAKLILDTPPSDLEINARKIRLLCDSDLRQAAAHGTTGIFLFTLVKCISISIKADVQEIEGINSMIKRIGERAPNMSLELLWARIAIKKRLNNDVRTKGRPSSSWAARRDNASMILDVATDFSEESQQLVTTKDPLRWTAPAPLNDVPTAKQLLKTMQIIVPELRSTPASQWASSCNKHIQALLPKPSVARCISLSGADLQDGSRVYLSVEKLYSVSYMTECIIQRAGENCRLCILQPLKQIPSTELLRTFFREGMPPLHAAVYKVSWCLMSTREAVVEEPALATTIIEIEHVATKARSGDAGGGCRQQHEDATEVQNPDDQVQGTDESGDVLAEQLAEIMESSGGAGACDTSIDTDEQTERDMDTLGKLQEEMLESAQAVLAAAMADLSSTKKTWDRLLDTTTDEEQHAETSNLGKQISRRCFRGRRGRVASRV